MKLESTMLGNLETVVADGLKVLTTCEQIVEFKSYWCDLENRSTAPFVWFQSHEWCTNWMATHGENCTPFIVMVFQKNKAVAVLPLMRTREKFGLHVLKILGAPHTQYANILTENGELDVAQTELIRKAIFAEQGVDQVLFNLVPALTPLSSLKRGAMELHHLDNGASLLDLTQFSSSKAFEESVGKKTTRNLRRAINFFEKQGKLKLDVVRPGDSAYGPLIDQCLSMKSEWLKQTGRVFSGLSCDHHNHFLASLKKPIVNTDGPIVFALMVNEQAIAIELGFLQRGHYYAYLGAFDWSLRSYSPGKLQMHYSIKWLVDQGAKTLDLLGNPAEYKQHYASFETPLIGFALAPTLRGNIYTRLWTGLGRPKAKQLYLSIPQNWRSSLSVLRKLEYNFIG